MNAKERAETIRVGNRFFNEKKILEAIDCFVRADYRDGLARAGDFFLYEKNEPLNALKLYKRAKHAKGLELLYEKMAATIRTLLAADTIKEDWDNFFANEGKHFLEPNDTSSPSILIETKGNDSAEIEDKTIEFTVDDFTTNVTNKQSVKELDTLREKLQTGKNNERDKQNK